jgi:hypothetical protein
MIDFQFWIYPVPPGVRIIRAWSASEFERKKPGKPRLPGFEHVQFSRASEVPKLL